MYRCCTMDSDSLIKTSKRLYSACFLMTQCWAGQQLDNLCRCPVLLVHYGFRWDNTTNCKRTDSASYPTTQYSGKATDFWDACNDRDHLIGRLTTFPTTQCWGGAAAGDGATLPFAADAAAEVGSYITRPCGQKSQIVSLFYTQQHNFKTGY